MARGEVTRAGWLGLAVLVVVAGLSWVAAGALAHRVGARRVPPLVDLADAPAPVRAALREAHAAAEATPDAASIGALGRAYHASQLSAAALAAYAAAEALEPGEWQWPYLRALLLEERNDAATEAALRLTTERAPTFGLAWYRLAEWHFKRGQFDEAASAYRHAADAPAPLPFVPAGVTAARPAAPLVAYARLGLARLALERGAMDEARGQLQQVVEAYPAFGPARALLRSTGATAATSPAAPNVTPFVPPADPVLDQLVADSRHSDVLLRHAGLAARGGDDVWREYLARRALAFNPHDLNVLMEMASMLQASNRPAEALEFLRQHEALAPGDHHGLVEQGRVLADLGRLAEAEAVLRRATAVRDAAAEYNLGTVLDQLGRWDEAKARYERAIAINPFHTRAMNNLGAGLDRRGATSTAIGWLQRAIEIAPDVAEYYVNYGSALIQLQRFAEAEKVLTEAIALDPREANAHNNLGIALASQSRLDRARDEFARALEIAPGHANARRNFDRVSAMLAAR